MSAIFRRKSEQDRCQAMVRPEDFFFFLGDLAPEKTLQWNKYLKLNSYSNVK